MIDEDTTQCIRCDSEVKTGGFHGLTLTFRQKMCALKLCQDCKDLADEQNHW